MNNFERIKQMTDKQIIIDGVDVSGCDRLNIFPMRYGIEPHEICLTSLEQWGGQEKYCKDRPNCYYKQLVKYKQALRDIKNIAVGITSTFYKGVEISTTYELLKQILQKCEVLDE